MPAVGGVEDGDGGPVGGLGEDGGGCVGPGPDVQTAPLHIYHPGAAVFRLEEGDAEILGQGQHDDPGGAVQVGFDPVGILHIVVEGQLDEDGGGGDLSDLPQSGGGLGAHQIGIGVDGLQAICDEFCRPLAVGAARVVEDDGPSGPARHVPGGGVGVEGQMEVVAPGVGGGDGRSGGHIRGIPAVPDAGGVQHGDHLVGQEVHPLLLGSAVDVWVPVLSTGR